MRKVSKTLDFTGNEIHKGDTVATISGSLTGKVSDIALETDNTAFVCLRAAHMPFSRGVWHPADQVQRIALARR